MSEACSTKTSAVGASIVSQGKQFQSLTHSPGYASKNRSEVQQSRAMLCAHCQTPLTWCCAACLLSAQAAVPLRVAPTLKTPPFKLVSIQQTAPFQTVSFLKAPFVQHISSHLPGTIDHSHYNDDSGDNDNNQTMLSETHANARFPQLSQISDHSHSDSDSVEVESTCTQSSIDFESPQARLEVDQSVINVSTNCEVNDVEIGQDMNMDKADTEQNFEAIHLKKKKLHAVFHRHQRKYSFQTNRKERNIVKMKLDDSNLKPKLEDSLPSEIVKGEKRLCESHQKSQVQKSKQPYSKDNGCLFVNHQLDTNRLTRKDMKANTCNVFTEDTNYSLTVGKSEFESNADNDNRENVTLMNLKQNSQLESDMNTSTRKDDTSKPKRRPKSKLVSDKYLGALKKPNGQTQFFSKFECAHCQEIFDKKRDFNNHISTHYHNRPHICVKCGDGFKTRLELRQHKLKIHSKLNKHPQYMCDQCPAEFKTEGRFHLHKKLHEENKLFSCKTCGFVAVSKEALNSHRLTHRKTERVQCEYCGETMRTNNMQRHILMHKGEKPYDCNQCDAAFRTPFDLKDHVKRRHAKIKPFSCEQCGKGFVCSDNLKHHLLVHSGQKPFQCSMCSSSFSRKDYLTKHIRTHTGEKPYKCADCEETFAYPSSLKLHRNHLHHDGCGREVLTHTQDGKEF